MSVLSTITKPASRPPIITICGDAGTGKTSLAATFPKPIFIRAEDGMNSIAEDQRPDAFPVVTDSETLFDQLMALVKEDHDYSTLVIDSVSRLEEVFVSEILANDKRAKGINQALGGYGNGPSAVAAMHGRVRRAAGVLNEKRHMAIVFISHADFETMRPPDMDDYSRHSLRLMPKSLPHYVDDVDLVGFVRLSSALRGNDGDRKKIVSDGTRELVCSATAASVAKNRFHITQALPFNEGENPLADALGITKRIKIKAVKVEEKETV
jgi:AAA domain